MLCLKVGMQGATYSLNCWLHTGLNLPAMHQQPSSCQQQGTNRTDGVSKHTVRHPLDLVRCDHAIISASSHQPQALVSSASPLLSTAPSVSLSTHVQVPYAQLALVQAMQAATVLR